MENTLLVAMEIHDFWYALPLIVAYSLVRAATRHERMGPILTHALRLGILIVGSFFVVLVVLQMISLAGD